MACNILYIKKLLVKCDDFVFRLEYVRDIILPKIKAALQNHFYVDSFIWRTINNLKTAVYYNNQRNICNYLT